MGFLRDRGAQAGVWENVNRSSFIVCVMGRDYRSQFGSSEDTTTTITDAAYKTRAGIWEGSRAKHLWKEPMFFSYTGSILPNGYGNQIMPFRGHLLSILGPDGLTRANNLHARCGHGT